MIKENLGLKSDGTPCKTPRKQRDASHHYYHNGGGKAAIKKYQAKPEVKERRKTQRKTQPWYQRSIQRRVVLPKSYSRQVRITIPITIVAEKDGNVVHSYCPSLKGLHTEGTGITQAVANAKVAAEAYMLSLIKHGESIPTK